MKKAIIFLILLVAITTLVFISNTTNSEPQYLRIHIRANSNNDIDQNVKYVVKEAVVEYISPQLKDVSTFKQAYYVLENNLSQMQKIADEALKNNNFDYKSKIKLAKENFPTREYQGLTLNSGVYDALIIELGSGVGDNWWCVVFPPLCFVGVVDDKEVEYKWFVAEIYNKIKTERS